jgi:hypothetical protein
MAPDAAYVDPQAYAAMGYDYDTSQMQGAYQQGYGGAMGYAQMGYGYAPAPYAPSGGSNFPRESPVC